MLAPTVLESSGGVAKARLVNRVSGAIAILSTNPFTIGREPSNTFVLDDALCSRNHALISQFTDPQGNVRYQLTDLSSSNGTYVGGQRLAPNQQFWLTPGNVIKIGTQEWTFEA
jgi:pSer/pThr/pTyr-binding forkhead associated (FHA) protein